MGLKVSRYGIWLSVQRPHSQRIHRSGLGMEAMPWTRGLGPPGCFPRDFGGVPRWQWSDNSTTFKTILRPQINATKAINKLYYKNLQASVKACSWQHAGQVFGVHCRWVHYLCFFQTSLEPLLVASLGTTAVCYTVLQFLKSSCMVDLAWKGSLCSSQAWTGRLADSGRRHLWAL